MTDRELNEIIDWRRKKLANEKRNPCGPMGKRMEGCEQAMKVVMSYLHGRKDDESDGEKTKTDYDDIWFESQVTRLGIIYM